MLVRECDHSIPWIIQIIAAGRELGTDPTTTVRGFSRKFLVQTLHSAHSLLFPQPFLPRKHQQICILILIMSDWEVSCDVRAQWSPVGGGTRLLTQGWGKPWVQG